MFFATFTGQMLPLLLTVCFPIMFYLSGKSTSPPSAEVAEGEFLSITLVVTRDVEDVVADYSFCPAIWPQWQPPTCFCLFRFFSVSGGLPTLPVLHHPGNKAPPLCC